MEKHKKRENKMEQKFGRKKILFVLMGILLLVGLAYGGYYVYHKKKFQADTGTKNIFSKRYVFWKGFVSRDTDRAQLLSVMQTAHDAGYNGMVITDEDAVFRWGIVGGTPGSMGYRKIVEDQASALGMAIILQNNPKNSINEGNYDYPGNTAYLKEVFPVKEAKYKVSSGKATIEPDLAVTVPNGGFEAWSTDPSYLNQPTNWFVDGQKVVTFRDTTIAHSGTSSIRIQDPNQNPDNGHGRIMTNYADRMSVKQFRTYEASIWIKTEAVSPTAGIRMAVYGFNADKQTGERPLYSDYTTSPLIDKSISPTQNWTQYKVVFNSLDKDTISLDFGFTSTSGTGKAWFDDLSVKEIGGLYDLSRSDLRPTTALKVNLLNADGTTINKALTEGTDFSIAPITGSNQYDLNIKNTNIANNSILSVSYYQKADIDGGDVDENMCSDAYWNKLKTDITHLSNSSTVDPSVYPSATGFLATYDELRVANWDTACNTINGGKEMTGGEYLAMAMSKTESLFKSVKPGADVYAWSDMFDPYHNAMSIYRGVNGSVDQVKDGTGAVIHKGSWTGLSPSTTIFNWNSQSDSIQADSLKFFAGLGNPQIIAGYYDSGSSLSGDKSIANVLNQLEANGGISNITGYMYTTWDPQDYSQLAATAAFWTTQGRWGASTDTTLPVSSLTSPVAGATLKGSATLTATASDNVGVSSVDFYYGTTPIGSATASPYTVTWDTTKVANGTYLLQAKAKDAAGNIGPSSTVSVTVNNVAPGDTIAPNAIISSPASGKITSNTTIKATASDNVGVVKFVLYMDSKTTPVATARSPFTSLSYTIKYGPLSSGSHTFQVKAYDKAGNVGTATITVTK